MTSDAAARGTKAATDVRSRVAAAPRRKRARAGENVQSHPTVGPEQTPQRGHAPSGVNADPQTLGAVPTVRVVAAARGTKTATDLRSSVAAAPGRERGGAGGGATRGTGAGGVRDRGEGERRAGAGRWRPEAWRGDPTS